ncbi:hypothetical protein KSP40_PGU017989 [Platanthera guangdongensis]|uniref:Ribosomal protein S14 n=1 Tax=Platanthera guangdongensis TaxID=2320717 RepID=A0ABR2LV57_9ASPA
MRSGGGGRFPFLSGSSGFRFHDLSQMRRWNREIGRKRREGGIARERGGMKRKLRECYRARCILCGRQIWNDLHVAPVRIFIGVTLNLRL